MEVAINSNIYTQAQLYALQKGQDLSAMIENYLRNYIQLSHTMAQQEVPDAVASLLGAGKPIAEDDLNGRQAYSSYLEEKYQ